MSVNVYPGTLDGYKVVSSGTASQLPPCWLLKVTSLLLLAKFVAHILDVLVVRAEALRCAKEIGVGCEECKGRAMEERDEGEEGKVGTTVTAVGKAEAERFDAKA